MWNNMLVSFRSHGDCGCSEQQVQTDIQFAEDDMTWVDQLPVLRINTGESFPASLCRFINSTAFIYLPAWLWSGSNVSVCFSHVGTYVWRHTHAQVSPYRHCKSSEDVCITGHITQRINKYRGVHQIHMTWVFFFSVVVKFVVAHITSQALKLKWVKIMSVGEEHDMRHHQSSCLWLAQSVLLHPLLRRTHKHT